MIDSGGRIACSVSYFVCFIIFVVEKHTYISLNHSTLSLNRTVVNVFIVLKRGFRTSYTQLFAVMFHVFDFNDDKMISYAELRQMVMVVIPNLFNNCADKQMKIIDYFYQKVLCLSSHGFFAQQQQIKTNWEQLHYIIVPKHQHKIKK